MQTDFTCSHFLIAFIPSHSHNHKHKGLYSRSLSRISFVQRGEQGTPVIVKPLAYGYLPGNKLGFG